jgi:hypothetical protein
MVRVSDLGFTLHDLFKLSPLPSSPSSSPRLLLLYLGMQTRSLLNTVTLLHRVLPSLRAGIAVLAPPPLSHALLNKRPFLLSISAIIRLLHFAMPLIKRPFLLTPKRPFLLTPKRLLGAALTPVPVPRIVTDRLHATTHSLPRPLHPPFLGTLSSVIAPPPRETAIITLVTVAHLLRIDSVRHGGCWR